MNPNTTIEPPQLHPPPQPPQAHRPSTSCDRHPDEHFTGFCPSCLCERLAVLDPSSSGSSSSRKPPPSTTTATAAAALKAIFKPSSGGGGGGNISRPSFFPELRRTKSFSASKNEGFSGVFEPQRKSCDVRVRNTLWSLFNQDQDRNKPPEPDPVEPRISISKENVESFTKIEYELEHEVENGDFVKLEHNLTARNSNARPIEDIIIEEEEEEPIIIEPARAQHKVEVEEQHPQQEEDLKTMKDHIDLDLQTKKTSGRDFKEIAGSFWSAAASVLTKKLKLKKRRNGSSATLPVEKPIGRQYRETQSEIADYGFGRRSCDTDPRFSLDAARMSFDAARMSFDAARMSFDDPRYSLDEPRASWDGYLVGRSFPRMPTMVSVVEDAPVNVVSRSDTQIPVEEALMAIPTMNSITEDEGVVPGGTAQTRDYYSDSSSRRRKSLDRSSSIRRTAAAVVAEIDELKSVSNAKVSPANVGGDYVHGPPKLVAPERDLVRDSNSNSNSNSLRDDCSESFERLGFRDHASVLANGDRKGVKKSRRWKAWNIWGLIHRRSVNKDEDDDRYSRANGVERSFSESWQELRGGDRNGDAKVGFNPKVLRSNSSVSWRNLQGFSGVGAFGSARKSNVETNGHYGRKKKDEFVLERNRSARYSPNHFDNGGLLRLHLMTPMRSSSRGGWGKSKPNHPQSIAGTTRSVLRMF